LALLRQREDAWRERFAQLEDAQGMIVKGLRVLANRHEQLRSNQKSLLKSLQRQQRPLAKSGIVPQGAETLAEVARRGVVAQAFASVLGAKGGVRVQYRPKLAAELLMKGMISQKDHIYWKRSGRAADTVVEAIKKLGR